MKSVAVTDHGNMFGAIDFYKKAKKHGIKPIIGLRDLRRARAPRQPHRARGATTSSCSPRTTTAGRTSATSPPWATWRGSITTRASTRSCCASTRGPDRALRLPGRRGRAGLIRGDMEAAAQAAREYKDIFGPGHFFLELQPNGLPSRTRSTTASSRCRRRPTSRCRHRRLPLPEAAGRPRARDPDVRSQQAHGRGREAPAARDRRVYVARPRR